MRLAFPEQAVPPTISPGALAPSTARAGILRPGSSIRPLLAPMAAAWLVNVGVAILLFGPAFRVYDAGFLPDSPFLRNAAFALAPDALLRAPASGLGALLSTLVYVVLATLAVASWCWAMRIARSVELASVWPLIAISALVLTPLLGHPALLSDDLYLYDLYGRTISVYGANPIVTAPSSFVNDPHLHWVHWKNLPSSYGPIWLMLSGVLSGIGGDSITTVVIVYRAAGAVLHLAIIAVVWHLLRAGRRRTAVAETLFYAWNPLVLLEVVGNAHNDVLVALFAVLLVAAAAQRAWLSAAFFGACAVLVKPFALLLVPGLARQIFHRTRGALRLRWLAAATSVGVATVVIVSLPLWAGTSLMTNVLKNPAATMYTNSVWELMSEAGPAWFGVGTSAIQHPYLDVLRGAAFLGAALWVLTRRSSRRDVPQVALRLWIVFCVTACWVWPWYFVPAIALAPLAGSARLPLSAGLTVGGLLFWTAWPEPRPTPLEWLYPWRSVVLFGPLLLASWAPARSRIFVVLGVRRHLGRRTHDSIDRQLQTAAG
ncbi:MAG: hypothetical protein H0W08_09900 [Acidobacteria bacterium]|nr:hypothetical protein [Acidobacteriota bacterium]